MDYLTQHFITKDGSSTLYSEQFDEHYHSVHGALQESMHVFIESGLHALPAEKSRVSILEMGLGTGLNALLTYLHKGNREVRYMALEAYPISAKMVDTLNYTEETGQRDAAHVFRKIHEMPWESWQNLGPDFDLFKHQTKLEAFSPKNRFDLVYFDAFAPNTQPELWTAEIFSKIYEILNPDAILVTYSAKGSVRRAMQSAGFTVEKIPGPPGKREMLRARC